MATAIPTTYAVEIRNKDDELKARVEHRISSLSWEWLAQGGCGRCSLTIEGDPYIIEPEADDNVLIYLPASGGGAELWYRGYLETVSRSLAGPKGSLALEFEGYYGWASRIIVHENVGEKVFVGREMSSIAESILDDFIVPQSPVTKGTIQEGLFSADRLAFKGEAADAFATLSELQGRVIYGVGPDREFYWYNESAVVGDTGKWFIGDHIVGVRDRTDFRSMVNEVFFEGGKVNGSTFSVQRKSIGHQDIYGIRQKLRSNGSITTNAVSSRFIKNQFLIEAVPKRQVSGVLHNIARRIEATLPIGPIEIIDPERYQHPNRYRADADPEGIYYGVGDYFYGETERHYIDRIRYTMTPEDGRVNAEVQFGDSFGISLTSSRIKQLELELSSVRQRSL